MLENINILKLNVKGLNNPIKQKTILTYLQPSGPHICSLQETHILARDTRRLRLRAFPQQYFSSHSAKPVGVAILILCPFRGKIGMKQAEIKGRLLALLVTIYAHTYTLGTICAPTRGRRHS